MIMRTVCASVLMAVAACGQEASVKPGVNEKFLDPELKVEEWTERFETESREIHRQREAIVKAVGIREGMVVADIGAGTGLFTMLFGKAAGQGRAGGCMRWRLRRSLWITLGRVRRRRR